MSLSGALSVATVAIGVFVLMLFGLSWYFGESEEPVYIQTEVEDAR